MNNTNYFAKVAQQNKLNELSDILKDIEINQSLLTQIQNYIREVETNPNYEKTAIIEIPDIDSDMAIGFERLDSEMGIRIEVCLGVMMDEEICRFEDCDLYDFFGNDNKGFEYTYVAPTEAERREIEIIRKQYGGKSEKEIKLERIRRLDSFVQNFSMILLKHF